MKKTTVVFVIFSLFLIYGLFLNQYSINITSGTLIPDNPPGFFDYKGVINIHTKESTGSGSLTDVVQAATEAGVDFLVINELNPYGRERRPPRYSNQILLFHDEEYSYKKSRILSLFNSTNSTLDNPAQAQLFLGDVLGNQPVASETQSFVIAHPLKPRYEWSGSIPKGVLGLEIINLKTIWQKAWLNERASFFWTLFTYLFNERLALMRLFETPEDEVKFWDQHNKNRKFFAFSGADAESRLRVSGNLFIRFPSYETLLSLTSNHILLRSELTGSAKDDQRKIVQAFQRGSFYVSVDTLANPKGFNVTIDSSDGEVYPMGSQLEFQEGLELVVRLPEKPKVPFDVIIYRNGERVYTSNSLITHWVIHEEGVYRVKVRVIPTFPLPDGKKWMPWIFSNPFYITPR